jgi:hypothetical protein
VRRFRRSVLALVSLAAVAVPVTMGALGDNVAAASSVGLQRSNPHDQTVPNEARGVEVAEYQTRVASPTKAQGTFVLPNFTCTSSNQAIQFAVGLSGGPTKGGGGGPSESQGFVAASCDGSGIPATFEGSACAYYSSPCSSSTITPAPGDSISITSRLTTSKATAVVDDITTGMVVSQTGPGTTSTGGPAWLGAQLVTGASSIPTFASVKYIDSTVNKRPISTTDPKTYSMTSTDGVTMVKPGRLNSTGSGFALKFKSSNFDA